MANAALHVRSLLDGLVTQLTTAVPTAITDIAADTTNTGLTLTNPIKYEVSSEFGEGEQRLPYVGVSVEGSSDATDWMSPQRDERVPILVVVLHHEAGNVSDADRIAWEYCRAVDLACGRAWTSISGVTVWHTTSTAINRPSEAAKWKRQSLIRGDVLFRTNQRG